MAIAARLKDLKPVRKFMLCIGLALVVCAVWMLALVFGSWLAAYVAGWVLWVFGITALVLPIVGFSGFVVWIAD